MNLNKIKRKILLILVLISVLSFSTGAYISSQHFKTKDKYIGLFSKANLELNSGNFKEAKELYSECLEIKPDDNIKNKLQEIEKNQKDLSTIREVENLYDTGKFKEALAKLDSIKSNFPFIMDKIYLLRIKLLKEL